MEESRKISVDIRMIAEQMGLDKQKLLETVFGKQPVGEPNK